MPSQYSAFLYISLLQFLDGPVAIAAKQTTPKLNDNHTNPFSIVHIISRPEIWTGLGRGILLLLVSSIAVIPWYPTVG